MQRWIRRGLLKLEGGKQEVGNCGPEVFICLTVQKRRMWAESSDEKRG